MLLLFSLYFTNSKKSIDREHQAWGLLGEQLYIQSIDEYSPLKSSWEEGQLLEEIRR